MINQAILAVVGAFLITEIIKTILHYTNNKEFKMFILGGMPSSHSATVAALVTSVYYETGVSILLLVVVIFGLIVIRDAYGVRWEVTKHSKALNKVMRTKEYEKTGHTRTEVVIGIVLGLAFATVVYLL